MLHNKHAMCVLNSVDKPIKKTVALKSNKKPRHFTRKLYERVSKTCSWWYPKFTPSGYKWNPKSRKENVNSNVSMPLGNASRTANVMDTMTSMRSTLVEIVLFIVDSRCSKHMTGNLKLLINFREKFLGTVKFGNDQIASILGYGDLTLHAYFAAEGILHQTFVARTPEQNGIVERQNRTLIEAARTMLSAAKVPLFFWAKAIATACFTQNRSLVIPRHEKTPYHIINDRKPSVKFFHIFGSICYIVRDGENLDKMKNKGNECIFVGYSTHSRAYRVFNKRTRVIMESIHVNFDELPHMASDHISSDPAPEYRTVTTSNELDLLFSLMFDELLNGSSKVVSKSSAEELHQFDRLDVWELVDRPLCTNVINLKWLWKNKRVNFKESFTPVARLEAVRLFIAYVAHKDMVRALLLDKKNQYSAQTSSPTPAPIKAIEPSCVTCGGNHAYQNCPATSGNVYQDNIQEYVSQAAAANYGQGNTGFRPQMVAN
nr:retrovirus-related Pol polyprotein from transposon TNT 1-94 [Tanacetum cinerariifolium]